MTTHWARYIEHWELLGPPLRPNPEVIRQVRSLVGDRTGCLLLGSTVEYAALGPHIIAMDASFPMLAALWKNGDPKALGIQSDWTRMPIGSGAFSCVLGDGSLNAVPSSALPTVLDELRRVLQPQGMLVARVFCRPAVPESMEDIRGDILAGRVGSFHALKWRVAMSVLRDAFSSDIAVGEIRAAVIAQYPDRNELCGITGWRRAEIETLDVYEGSTAVYNFPTESAIAALVRRWFADVEIVRCGTYELADRCPLVVARNPLPAMR